MGAVRSPALRAASWAAASVLLATGAVRAGAPPAAPDPWTRERIEATTPRWPNPFLAFLPAGAAPDMAYWRARMAMEALDRRLARGVVETVVVPEQEPDGALGGNDHPRVGEPLAQLGSLPWTGPEVAVTGFLREDPADGGTAVEPDGSIGSSTQLTVPAGERVSVEGVIGDGAYGAGGSTPSGDFDFFAVAASAGDTIEVLVRTPEPMLDLDPIVAVYGPAGTVLGFNDNIPLSGFLSNRDSWLTVEAPAAGTYHVAVGGWSPFADPLPADPADPASGPGAGSEGAYRLVVGVEAPDPGDRDCFRVAVRAGDVLGATVVGASGIAVTTLDDVELVATSGGDLSAIYPSSSTLPGGGGGTVARTVDADGELAVCVTAPLFYEVGEYRLELRLDRSPLDREPTPRRQVLFVDLDGAVVDASAFGGPPRDAVLSPLSAFLAGWGLAAGDEDALVDGILQAVRDNLEHDVRHRGGNGDAAASGLAAEFDIEVRSSRDHPDPGDDPGVARIVVGGTIEQLGVPTVGIAEHIDPGNLETAGTAVVLLDLLSAPAPNPTSLNTVDRAPGVPLLDVVALAVGNIVAHEAGHLFGNFHTDRDRGLPTIMDTGGDLLNVLGAGDDGVVGTADDLDVDLGPDDYSPREIFRGVENTLEVVSFGLPLGGDRPRIAVGPPAVRLGPVDVGAAAGGTVRIGSVGTAPLAVSGSSVGGPSPAPFSVVAGGGPVVLPPGGSAVAELSFVPAGIGPAEAVLDIASDDPGAAVVAVPLEGRGGVPAGSVGPSSLDFGTLVYGDASVSATLEVTVSNGGVGPLTVDHAVLSGGTPHRFGIDAGGAPFVLQPGASRLLEVSFRPGGEVGESHTTLALLGDDPAAPRLDVALEGIADGPDVDVDPPSPYAFGSATVGETRRRDFLVVNLGTRPLQVDGSEVAGDAGGGFAIAFGDGAVQLEPGEAHVVRVTAAPVEDGRFEGELRISSDDPDESELVVELLVEGVVPELVVSPPSHDFGPVRIGDAAVKRFFLVNEGEGRLQVEPPALAGSDPGAFGITAGGGVPIVLLEGGVWPIDVEFRPHAAGGRTAELVLESNDPTRPRIEVPLAGTGALPELAIDKSCRGGVSPGCTVEVANLGAVAATGVVVEDLLPDGVAWVGDGCGAGPPTGGTWTWQVGTLEAGDRAACTLELEIDGVAGGPVVNLVTVRWDGTPSGQVDDLASAEIPLAAPIPAVGTIGLVLLSALLAAVGVWVLRREG